MSTQQQPIAAPAAEAVGVQTPTDGLRLLVLLWHARVASAPDEVTRLANDLETEIVADSADDIGSLYAQLRALASTPATSESEQEFQMLLRRLRALQEAEARAMAEHFDRHRPLPAGSGYEALRHAEEVLARAALTGYPSVAAAHASVHEAAKTTP